MKRSRNGFYLVAADVNELAQKKVDGLLSRPDIAKLNVPAIGTGPNGEPTHNDQFEHERTRGQFREISRLLDTLRTSCPEAYKLFPWIVREYKQGRLGGVITGDLQRHIRDIVRQLHGHLEYTRSNPTEQTPDVNRMTFQEAEQWVYDRQSAGVQLDNSIKWDCDQEHPVYQFKDGWKITQLFTEHDLKQEGELMGHCVGGYCQSVHSGGSVIYSLHDPAGQPHVTLEFVGQGLDSTKDEQDRTVLPGLPYTPHAPVLHGHEFRQAWQIVQIQGKGNQTPIPEYQQRIKDWFDHLRAQDVTLSLQEGGDITDLSSLEDWVNNREYQEENGAPYGIEEDARPDVPHGLPYLAERIAEELLDGYGYGTEAAGWFNELCDVLGERAANYRYDAEAPIERQREIWIEEELEKRKQDWENESAEQYTKTDAEGYEEVDYEAMEEAWDDQEYKVKRDLESEAESEYEDAMNFANRLSKVAYDAYDVADELATDVACPNCGNVNRLSILDTDPATAPCPSCGLPTNDRDTFPETSVFTKRAASEAEEAFAHRVYIEWKLKQLDDEHAREYAVREIAESLHLSEESALVLLTEAVEHRTEHSVIDQYRQQMMSPRNRAVGIDAPKFEGLVQGFGSIDMAFLAGARISAAHDFDYQELTGPVETGSVLDYAGKPIELTSTEKAVNVYYAGHIIGSVIFQLSEETVDILSVYMNPTYRQTNAFFVLMRPLLAYRKPIEGFIVNPRLQRIWKRWLERAYPEYESPHTDWNPAWTPAESNWLRRSTSGFYLIAANIHELAERERRRLVLKHHSEQNSERSLDLISWIDPDAAPLYALPDEAYKLYKYIAKWVYNDENLSRWSGQNRRMLHDGAQFLIALRAQNKAWPQLNNMTWEDFKAWVFEQKYLQAGQQAFWTNQDVIYSFENEWYIALLHTPEEYAQEGEMMGNCVGEYCDHGPRREDLYQEYEQAYQGIPNFINPHSGPITRIYSLRDQKGMPHVDIEMVDHKTGDHAGEWVVGQIKGQTNSVVKPEYKAMIKEWLTSQAPHDQIVNRDDSYLDPAAGRHYEISDLDELERAYQDFLRDPEPFSNPVDTGEIGQNEYGISARRFAPAHELMHDFETTLELVEHICTQMMQNLSVLPENEYDTYSQAVRYAKMLYFLADHAYWYGSEHVRLNYADAGHEILAALTRARSEISANRKPLIYLEMLWTQMQRLGQMGSSAMRSMRELNVYFPTALRIQLPHYWEAQYQNQTEIPGDSTHEDGSRPTAPQAQEDGDQDTPFFPESRWLAHVGLWLVETNLENAAANARQIALQRLRNTEWYPVMAEMLNQLPDSHYRMFDWIATRFIRGDLPQWIEQYNEEVAHLMGFTPATIPPAIWAGQVFFVLENGGAMLEAARARGQAPDLQAMHWRDFLRWYQEAYALLQARQNRWKERNAVYAFPNGWTIEHVTNPDDLITEGEMMGHCVGQKCEVVEAGLADVYSLRDRQGVPHATIYFENGMLNQIRGQTNGEPKQEYKDMVYEWIKTLNLPEIEPVMNAGPQFNIQAPEAPNEPWDGHEWQDGEEF